MSNPVSLQKLKVELAIVESELSTLVNRGTSASAITARAHLLNIKREADAVRKEILIFNKELKKKRKDKKTAKITPEPEPEPVQVVEEPEPEPVVEEEPEPEVIKVKRTRRVPAGRKARTKK